MTALAPGLYRDISSEAYHADTLTPEPSLSRSGIVTLLDPNCTPLDFATRHPRLSEWPGTAKPATKAMDFGLVVEAMVLGCGSEFVAKDIAEFRNKDGSPAKTWGNASASTWKDAQEAAGRIVIDIETHSRACFVADHLTAALARRFPTWETGEAQVTLAWQRSLNDGSLIWCRARPDYYLPAAGHIIDLKVTSLGLSDSALGKTIALDGLDVQDCWYRSGLETVCPAIAGRSQFTFAFASSQPPYRMRFVDLPEHWRHQTNQRIDVAAHQFGRCLAANRWPDWPEEANVTPPGWIEAQWEAYLIAAASEEDHE